MRRLFFLSLAVFLAACAGPARSAVVPPESPPSWIVPYTMTSLRHVMVRAKINGHGPYNFIIDSGAQALFIEKSVSEEAGVKAASGKWGSAEVFEIEGGPKLRNARVRIDDLFQLDGINGLGIAGIKIQGVMGYDLLSHYRLEFDFTSDAMTWTELAYTPVQLQVVHTPKEKEANLDWVGDVAKVLGFFIGKPIVPPTRRGSIGIGLEDTDTGVTVTKVFENSPAAKAGIQPADRIVAVNGRSAKTISAAMGLTAGVAAGDSMQLTLIRDGKSVSLSVQAGEGL